MIAENTLIENLTSVISTEEGFTSKALELLGEGESRYLRDAKVNVQNALVSDHITEKEAHLLALSIAVNNKSDFLIDAFKVSAKKHEANAEEIAEAVACASLLASNNVFYRFRHFLGKDKYNQLPAKIKMNIMMKPVTGKEFFELMSLAVSAVNGCEMCVNAHEASLIELGSSEERIFDAVRIASVVTSLSKLY